MIARWHAKTIVAAVVMFGLAIATVAICPLAVVGVARAEGPSPALTRLLDYLQKQNTTGFLVIRDGKTLVEQNWPAPTDNRMFANFVYERTADGALLEDTASQQKSFIAVLMAIAIDKGLIEVDKPVSDVIGKGWSRASPEQEERIRIVDLLTMTSGLDEKFGYESPAGTAFFYNTPVYAVTKRILAVASKQSLETLTQAWLTGPLGMTDTAWRKRPPALASVGNDTGLVTSPRDTARFGLMILNGGVAENGTRVVSDKSFKAMFARTATNPAYGQLWWLNGGAYAMRALAGRKDGPRVAAAPADMVAAYGAFERRLYVVPSLKLVVVRLGAAAPDRQFDEQLWARLTEALR
jgi:CubicO group peptidase (beta-lactamase class C family)